VKAASDRAVLTDFIDELHREFPSFRIVKKGDSSFAKAIDVALKIITFGGQREFMDRYYTVIGDTLYVPLGWDDTDPIDAVITLRHERIHLRQRRRLTFPVMIVVYLLLPLPLGLAYGRARLEWEAYTETLRATLELRGREALRSTRLRDRIVSQFTSPAYGWMWPFRGAVERWYDTAVDRLLTDAPPMAR
jgi:hypothetical protein